MLMTLVFKQVTIICTESEDMEDVYQEPPDLFSLLKGTGDLFS